MKIILWSFEVLYGCDRSKDDLQKQKAIKKYSKLCWHKAELESFYFLLAYLIPLIFSFFTKHCLSQKRIAEIALNFTSGLRIQILSFGG